MALTEYYLISLSHRGRYENHLVTCVSLWHVHSSICTCTPALTHLHSLICTHPPALTHLHTPTCTHPPAHTCTHLHTHTCTHPPAHTCTHLHSPALTCTHPPAHTCTHPHAPVYIPSKVCSMWVTLCWLSMGDQWWGRLWMKWQIHCRFSRD